MSDELPTLSFDGEIVGSTGKPAPVEQQALEARIDALFFKAKVHSDWHVWYRLPKWFCSECSAHKKEIAALDLDMRHYQGLRYEYKSLWLSAKLNLNGKQQDELYHLLKRYD